MRKKKGGKPAGMNDSQTNSPQGATLEEWLAKMRRNDDQAIMRQRFPTEPWKDEYISTIATRPEEEVLFLIRSFLIQSSFTYLCALTYLGLMYAKKEAPDYFRTAMAEPFVQQLVRYQENPHGDDSPPWEGNTWRLFRCSGRLYSKIHRKSLDLSGLRPVNSNHSVNPSRALALPAAGG